MDNNHENIFVKITDKVKVFQEPIEKLKERIETDLAFFRDVWHHAVEKSVGTTLDKRWFHIYVWLITDFHQDYLRDLVACSIRCRVEDIRIPDKEFLETPHVVQPVEGDPFKPSPIPTIPLRDYSFGFVVYFPPFPFEMIWEMIFGKPWEGKLWEKMYLQLNKVETKRYKNKINKNQT